MRISVFGINLNENEELFLLKNHKTRFVGGGCKYKKESVRGSLEREFSEEITGAELERIVFYKKIVNPDKVDHFIMAYFVQFKGEPKPKPLSEITGVFYARYSEITKLSKAGKLVVDDLKRNNITYDSFTKSLETYK